jgi:hypothetical protein
MTAARVLGGVAQRQEAGSLRQLLRGVAWWRAAFRFGWGPSAPPIMQGVFAAAGELAGERVAPPELATLGLGGDGPTIPARDIRAAEVEQLMDRAHTAGITGVGGSFSSITRADDGSIRFRDLRRARKHRGGTVSFAAARDADRCAFNRRFNASLLTEASARKALDELRSRGPAGTHYRTSVDVVAGLVSGQAQSSDGGAGRGEFFDREIVAPIVAGRRVLDLSSNDGSLLLMLLRSGVRELVAAGYTAANADLARLHGRILAWRDLRPYNLTVLTGDMRMFLSEDLGYFDVVTAFNPLYYLPEEDMARLIARAALMDAVLVLRANEALENDLPGRTLDLHRLMRDNGYAEIAVHTPAGFTRPLLIGHTFTAAAARL